MNTPQFVRFYPVFLDALRCFDTGTRSLESMLENVLRAEVLRAKSARRYSVKLRDQDSPTRYVDHLGFATEDYLHEFIPARVYAWARRQLVGATDMRATDVAAAGWLASLMDYAPAEAGIPGQPVPATTAAPTVFTDCQGTAAELAGLLRGLRAYQKKRRKAARKLVRQMWAYHLAQSAPLPSATPTLRAAA